MGNDEILEKLQSYMSDIELMDFLECGGSIPVLQNDIHMLSLCINSMLNVFEMYGIDPGIYKDILRKYGEI